MFLAVDAATNEYIFNEHYIADDPRLRLPHPPDNSTSVLHLHQLIYRRNGVVVAVLKVQTDLCYRLLFPQHLRAINLFPLQVEQISETFVLNEMHASQAICSRQL